MPVPSVSDHAQRLLLLGSTLCLLALQEKRKKLWSWWMQPPKLIQNLQNFAKELKLAIDIFMDLVNWWKKVRNATCSATLFTKSQALGKSVPLTSQTIFTKGSDSAKFAHTVLGAVTSLKLTKSYTTAQLEEIKLMDLQRRWFRL